LSKNSLSAAHIVGGDVTYKCISSNPITKTTKFTVTFTLYRDVAGNGAPFDINARFGIYESAINANVWTHKQTIISNPINIQTVPYDDNCVIVPPSILIEKANYIFDIELPWSDKVFPNHLSEMLQKCDHFKYYKSSRDWCGIFGRDFW
jgi:hypothetical protein